MQAAWYCNVLMIGRPSSRLQEALPKTRDQKSLLKTTGTLFSFLAVLGICRCSFHIFGAVGRTPQKPSVWGGFWLNSLHFACRSSTIVATKARKAQKLQLPVKTFRKHICQRSSNSCFPDRAVPVIYIVSSGEKPKN